MKTTLARTLMTLILGVCMLLALVGCGASQAELDAAVNEAVAPLNERITALEGDIADQQEQLAALESEKAALVSEKEALEAEIAALETAQETLEGQKAALEARVSELEGIISAKDTEISSLKTSIATLTAEKQTLTDKVAELEGKNSDLEEEIATLKNCFAGNHVLDTKGEIRYVWSKGYWTCSAVGTCLYCDHEATLTVDGVTDGNLITALFDDPNLEMQVVHTVTTHDELRSLLESGETVTIRLDETLENIQSLNCRHGTTAVLDMNGNDLILEPQYAFNIDDGSLTLKGEGTISASEAATMVCRGSLFIEDNVTLSGDLYAIMVNGYMDQPKEIRISGGTFTAKYNGVNFCFVNDSISLIVTGGTFSSNPTAYVDTEKYAVTDNENGTWSVSCNHNNSTHTTAADNGDHTHDFTCTVCGRMGKENHGYEESNACICGARPISVSTPDELFAAYEQGGDIKLMGSLSRPNDPSFEGITSDVAVYLNGYDITITPNGGGLVTSLLSVADGGSLTVIGDGTVTHEHYGPSIWCDGGELTVHGGTFNSYVDVDGGTVTIVDGTFNGYVDTFENSAMIYGGTFNDLLHVNGGTVTIVDGTFNSYVDTLENSTLTIHGGTFHVELNLHMSDVTITGGTFHSPIHALDSNVTITGGTFSVNPTAYVDTENYFVTNNENGTWTVMAR